MEVTPELRELVSQVARQAALEAAALVAQDARPPLPSHVGVGEAADLLGLSVRTVRSAIAGGELAVVRVSPRRLQVAVAELERFRAARLERRR